MRSNRGRKMKIYCHAPTKDDAPSAYRGFGVISELARCGIYSEFWNDFDFLKAKGFSALFMQRPDTPSQCEIIMVAKSMGMPVVIDYDDNLLDIPPHNKYYQHMEKNNPEYKDCVKFCLSEADAVIVSTDALKTEFEQYSNKITVIRNAFDDYVYTMRPFNKTKTVIWRGGDSHTKDLETYKEDIISLITANEDFHFIFMGAGFPTYLKELKSKNMTLKEPAYTYDFLNVLKDIKPSLIIVPLEDTSFNKCKSDCAKIEAIASGALCISPNWAEWNYCPYTYDRSLFKSANAILERIREFDPALIKEHRTMQDYIRQFRLLSKANIERAKVFNVLAR